MSDRQCLCHFSCVSIWSLGLGWIYYHVVQWVTESVFTYWNSMTQEVNLCSSWMNAEISWRERRNTIGSLKFLLESYCYFEHNTSGKWLHVDLCFTACKDSREEGRSSVLWSSWWGVGIHCVLTSNIVGGGACKNTRFVKWQLYLFALKILELLI